MKRRAILIRVQSSSEMFAQLKALDAEANRATLQRLMPIWTAMFWFTVVTGFAAAALLFYSFLATLFEWPQWP